MARRYTHVQELLPEIKAMLSEGRSQREIAEPVDIVAEQAYEIKRLKMEDEKKRVAAELQLHSDQGFQYTSQGYFNLTQEYSITPSMSRRGNCYDNAMAENFFSILKTECIYRQKIRTFQQAKELIDDFIYFYNHERIQLKTGETPLAQRLSA